jgi:hypothetical protein
MSKVTVGLWVPLQAKLGKEAEVEAFLKAGQALVEDEPGTTAWFAVQIGPGQFADLRRLPRRRRPSGAPERQDRRRHELGHRS